VATFYGLLTANLIVNPIGDAIFKNSYDDEKLGEIALQSILLASEKTNLLEAQELLNSYVNPRDRVDVIGAFAAEAENEVAA
jgi:flagellar motor component MotA